MFCSSCGKPVDDNARFCGNCGAPVIRPTQAEDPGMGSADSPAGDEGEWGNYSFGDTETRSYSESNSAGEYEYQAKGFDPYAPGPVDQFLPGKQRSIALCIILSIVTCGIYMLYWMAVLNDEINRAVDDNNATPGGLVVLLSIVTCNIYAWYWLYKMGEKISWIEQRSGSKNNNNSILYLILGILGLDIIPLALMQDTMNQL